jgi:ATP/ADP translocase
VSGAAPLPSSHRRRLPSLPPLLARVVQIESTEIAGALWSFTYFFAVLCAYYIIRPVRDEMGVTSAGRAWSGCSSSFSS